MKYEIDDKCHGNKNIEDSPELHWEPMEGQGY